MKTFFISLKPYDSTNGFEMVGIGYSEGIRRMYIVQDYKVPYNYTCSNIEVFEYDDDMDNSFPYKYVTTISPTLEFYQRLKDIILSYYSNMDICIELSEMLPAHYYMEVPDIIMKIRFKYLSDFKTFNNQNEFKLIIEDRDLLFKFKLYCHDDNITPEFKYMIEYDLKYMCWCTIDIDINKLKSINRIPYNSITSVDDEEIVKLDEQYTIPFKVASFDIEVHNAIGNIEVNQDDIKYYSSGFPSAKITTNFNDPINGNGITHISLMYREYKNISTNKIYNFTCIDTNEHSTIEIKKHDGECINIPKYKLIVCKNEQELLTKFLKYLKSIAPDFLYGHNSFSFDVKYIYERMKHYSMDYSVLNLYINDNKITNYSWNSNAYRNINIFKPNTDIINWSDTLVIAVKDFPNLNGFSLEALCNQFLKDMGKLDMKYNTMFEVFEKYRLMIQMILYLYNSNDELDISDTLISKIDKLKNDVREWNRAVADYCIIDSVTLLDIIERWNLLEKLTQTCRVDNIAPHQVYERGTVIRNYHSMYRECLNNNFYINRLHVAEQYRIASGTRYKGSHVFKPKPIMKRFMLTLDFSSLYPSIIITYNLCHTTLIRPEDYDKYNDDECYTFEIEMKYYTDDTEKNIVSYIKTVKVIKPHIRKGIIPEVLKKKLVTRKQVKDMMKKISTKDMDEQTKIYLLVLDMYQLAIKVSCNSAYGAFGTTDEKDELVLESNKSIVSLKMKDIAAIVTIMGQKIIKDTSDKAMDLNFITDYGDTDSIMCNKLEYESYRTQDEYNKIIIEANELCTYLNQYFINRGQPTLNLNLENIALMVMTVSKKGYLKICYDYSDTYLNVNIDKDEDGYIDSNQFKVAGLLSKRRDNTKWSRLIFNKLTSVSMTNRSLKETFTFLFRMLTELYDGKVDVELLYKTIKLKSKNEYKPNTEMYRFISNLESRGHDITKLTSDRIRVIYIDNGKEKKVDRMYLLDEYDSSTMTLDYNHYIEQPINAIDKILNTTLKYNINKFIKSFVVHYAKEAMSELNRNDIKKLITSDEFIDSTSSTRYDSMFIPRGCITKYKSVLNKYVTICRMIRRKRNNYTSIMNNIFIYIAPNHPEVYNYIVSKLYNNKLKINKLY